MAVEGDRGGPPPAPAFGEALRFWSRLGWISFGGPAGQIAIMHAELVDARRWVSERRFLEGLDFCMLLPGPEAQQLATYLGWRLHGWRGGLAAGSLFVLPSVLVLWLLSYAYFRFGAQPAVAGLAFGLKAAVLALIARALWRLGRKVLATPVLLAVAAASGVLLGFGRVPFPALILGAGLIGVATARFAPRRAPVRPDASEAEGERRETLDVAGARRMAVVCLIAWLVPVAALTFGLGPGHVLARMALFFSKAALVTFGGAYAVLPYVAQQAVSEYAWLDAGQMMVGLALAETTPGPLIMVLEFVGFAGGWQHPGALDTLLAATLCALVTVWCTFVPSLALVFAGAPWIERLGRLSWWRDALAAISAAVLGVMASLALWFALHAAWDGQRVDWRMPLLAAALLLLSVRGGVSVPLLVALGGALGLWLG